MSFKSSDVNKMLILIENQSGFKALLNMLESQRLDAQTAVIVNLNSGQVFKLPERYHARFNDERDYLAGVDQVSINKRALADVREWLKHPELKSFFYVGGIDATRVLERSMARAVTTIYKFIETVTHILNREKPDEIVFFSPIKESTHGDIRFWEKDLLIPHLIQWVQDSGKWNPMPKLREIRVSMPELKLSSARSLLWRIQHSSIFKPLAKLFNRMTLRSISDRKTVLITGAPRLMFPLMHQLKKDRSRNIIYFQRQFSPTLLLSFIKNRIHYWVQIPSEISTTNKNEANLKDFIRCIKEHHLFEYRGVSLSSMLSGKFKYCLSVWLANIIQVVRDSRQMLQKTNAGVLLVDEEASYESRTLVLVAKQMGIKTAEYQHGVIVSYFLQKVYVDKMFVWGDYFKSKVKETVDIEEHSIAVVGPVHLDYLWRYRNPKIQEAHNRSDLRKKFKISSRKPILLFTPHSFRKGSRGGLLLSHQTREESEQMMDDVLDAASDNKCHVLIKLHHGDDNSFFYKDRIKNYKVPIPYSIVQKGTIYELLNASDFLVTPLSTAILEAIILNKSVVFLDYGMQRQAYPYARWRAVPCMDKIGMLTREIRQLLDHGSDRVFRFEEGRRRILNEFVCGMDQSSGQRLRREVEELIR